MSVRVRFAPSPTGNLHIGNARTALYNYLYAKASSGVFVLRVEDTDQERSKKEFEDSQMSDLAWLGIEFDEGPNNPGEFGPYRQSERLEIYDEYAQKLMAEGNAYHCFCSTELLEAKKAKAIEAGVDPQYDGTCRGLSADEVSTKKEAGESFVIRFRAPDKGYKLCDHVRGEVNFPAGMVGDFVLVRSGGLPIYNFACVVDDMLMKITHVIRGEDHLNNTLRQLMLYEALGSTAPEFAHASLLIGSDRQKLSKRHGATSVAQYKEGRYLPQALTNYLCLLGWSHPDELDVFSLGDLESVFSIDRFNKAAAIYDLEKLAYINGQHLRKMDDLEIFGRLDTKELECTDKSDEWKIKMVTLFKKDANFFSDIEDKLSLIFGLDVENSEEVAEVQGWESTTSIRNYVGEKLASMDGEYLRSEDLKSWMGELKSEFKIKGKELFKGLRVVLTGRAHGPDLGELVTLTTLTILKKRVSNAN